MSGPKPDCKSGIGGRAVRAAYSRAKGTDGFGDQVDQRKHNGVRVGWAFVSVPNKGRIHGADGIRHVLR